ncbi:hypothetical protein HK102_007255, partial [Quaeritorhiza haematococci]
LSAKSTVSMRTLPSSSTTTANPLKSTIQHKMLALCSITPSNRQRDSSNLNTTSC